MLTYSGEGLKYSNILMVIREMILKHIHGQFKLRLRKVFVAVGNNPFVN